MFGRADRVLEDFPGRFLLTAFYKRLFSQHTLICYRDWRRWRPTWLLTLIILSISFEQDTKQRFTATFNCCFGFLLLSANVQLCFVFFLVFPFLPLFSIIVNLFSFPQFLFVALFLEWQKTYKHTYRQWKWHAAPARTDPIVIFEP